MGRSPPVPACQADHGRASSAPPLGAVGCSEAYAGLPAFAAVRLGPQLCRLRFQRPHHRLARLAPFALGQRLARDFGFSQHRQSQAPLRHAHQRLLPGALALGRFELLFQLFDAVFQRGLLALADAGPAPPPVPPAPALRADSNAAARSPAPRAASGGERNPGQHFQDRSPPAAALRSASPPAVKLRFTTGLAPTKLQASPSSCCGILPRLRPAAPDSHPAPTRPAAFPPATRRTDVGIPCGQTGGGSASAWRGLPPAAPVRSPSARSPACCRITRSPA